MTSRVGREGGSNIVLGLDGIFRLFGDDYLTFKWAQSTTSGDGDRGPDIDSSRIFLRWERRSNEGLAYDVYVGHVGADHEPDLGIQRRSDASWAFGRLAYGWLPDAPSTLYSHSVELYGFAARRNSDGALESARLVGLCENGFARVQIGCQDPVIYYISQTRNEGGCDHAVSCPICSVTARVRARSWSSWPLLISECCAPRRRRFE